MHARAVVWCDFACGQWFVHLSITQFFKVLVSKGHIWFRFRIAYVWKLMSRMYFSSALFFSLTNPSTALIRHYSETVPSRDFFFLMCGKYPLEKRESITEGAPPLHPVWNNTFLQFRFTQSVLGSEWVLPPVLPFRVHWSWTTSWKMASARGARRKLSSSSFGDVPPLP